METPMNLQEELRAAILAENRDSDCIRDNADQILQEGAMLSSADNRGTEDLPGDVNAMKEELKALSTEDGNTTLNKDQNALPKPSILDNSAVDKCDNAANEMSCGRYVNSELRRASFSETEDGECISDTPDKTLQEGGLFSIDSREAEGDMNSLTKEEDIFSNIEDHDTTFNTDSKEESKFSNMEDNNTIFYKDQNSIPKLNISDSFKVDKFDNAVNFPGGAENFPENVNSMKKEKLKVLSTEENITTCNNDQHVPPQINVSGSSAVDISGNERSSGRSVAGLSLEFEDLKEKYQKLRKERNSLQQKRFEMQSEFCSVEIERDLEKETSRYLEEQLSAINSSLLLKENELVSLRKRYKLLNEGFLNSELLREGLERDVSGLTEVISGLEERLESSEEVSKNNERKVKTEVSAEYAEEKAKLETQILILNETLEKERNAKISVEEMFKNVEEERSLLLKEVEELRNEQQKQINEVNVLRDLLHDKNKQDQTRQLEGQQLQRELAQKQQQQNKEVTELRECKVQFSNKISLLQNENKKLEDELYQQLAFLEKLECENKSFSKSKKELGEITDKLKVLRFCTVDQLISEYSVSQEGKLVLETRIRQLEHEISNGQISKEKVESNSSCPHLETNCTKSSCVPASEYLKLKFQLKSLTEEVNALKQVSGPKIVKEKVVTSTTNQERRSRKHENRIAKMWLKTMKDSMNDIVKEDDFATEQCSTLLLANQLHEANIRVDELQHELDISRKEKEYLVSTNGKYKDELEALKQRLVESQETQNALLREMKLKLEKIEKILQDEVQMGIKKEEKIVHLEGQNQEMCIEFEKLKERLQSSQKEKDKIENELEALKRDILKNFGSLNIQSVSKTFTSVKEKSHEYVKIIQANNDNLVKLTQDLNSLQQVNTILREELNEARIQIGKKDEAISKKYLSESISEKRESDRLQVVIQALESSKQNEKELLSMYTKEKQGLEKLQEELMNLYSELQETKILLSEKEKECETTNRIIRELEATCGVYEEEFDKSTAVHENDNIHLDVKENGSSSDESQEDDLSESGSDSTAENFREMQEVLQERMATKVKRLQNRLEETLAALSSYQKLNINLQRRLHDAEKKNLEKVEVDGKTPDQEFLEATLNKLAEKEREIQEILQRNSSDSELVNQESVNENNVDEMLSPYKEIIKQLKIDNAKYEVRLVEANERIAKLEEKLASCQYYREGISNDVFTEEQDENKDSLVKNYENETCEEHTRIVYYSGNFTVQNVSTTMASKEDLNEGDNVVATNDNFKEELDCMTAKYINLKAAFDGCLKRLRILEVGHDGNEEGMAGNAVNIVGTYESSHVIQEMVFPKFISPLQGKKPETAEFCNGFQELTHFENYQDTQAIQGSSFSEISCAFLESDSELNSIASDRMVIELTLTENDMDSLEVPGTCEEFLQERLDFEKETGCLRARIIELEKLNSTTTNEVHRVKQYSLDERTDLQNKLRYLQELNNTMKVKLVAAEVERNSLEEHANELDNKYLEARQELQRIKSSVSKERKISENTIKGLKDQENTMKKKMVELETGKEELRMRVEELKGKLQECSQETQRVKVESNNESINLKNVLNGLKDEIDANKKEKESYTLKISELKLQFCMLEDETRKFKICLQKENLKHEETIRKLEGVILDMEKENKELKSEKSDALLTNKELKDRSELLIKNQELKMVSILEEKKGLENRTLELKTEITTLEETLVLEKVKNDDLTCKFKKEEEESKIILLNERKTFEDTIKQLQEKIMILEKEIADLSFKKDSSVSIIKELENKIDSLSEENKQSIEGLSNEKQKLEDTTKELQNTITKLTETFMVANMEKDHTISLIKKENETLLFEERKQLGDIEKKCQDKISILEERIQDSKLKKDIMEARIKKLENKICSSSEEQSQEKTCWLDEKKNLEIKIEQLEYTITTKEEKFSEEMIEKDTTISELQKENEDKRVAMFEERRKFKNSNNEIQEAILMLEKIIEKNGNDKDDGFERKVDGDANCVSDEKTKVLEASLVKDTQMLDNTISLLHSTILALEEMIEKENIECKTLLSTLSKKNEDNNACLLNLTSKFEDEIKEMQDKVAEKEIKIQEQKFETGSALSKIQCLEDELTASNEEISLIRNSSSNQKQSLEDTIKHLQTTIIQMKNEVKEKQAVGEESESRLGKMLSAIEVENQSLKIENEKLETQVLSSVDEIQRIKALSFNEKQTLEADVKQLKENSALMEKMIIEDKQTIQHLDLVRKDFETKCLYLQNELERVKICSFKESQLEDKIEKLTEALSSIEKKFENLKIEKDRLVSREKELAAIILALQEELQRIKVCAFEERQNMVAKDENYNALVEESKSNFEYQMLVRDREISSLKLTVSELDDLRKGLESDNKTQKEEVYALKTAMENLQNEKNSFENNVFDYGQQISNLRTNLIELDEDKRSFETKVLQQDEKLSSVREDMDELQNEKKLLQGEIVKRDERVSLLELNVSRLEEQRIALETDMLQQGQEKSTTQIFVANLEKEKISFKDGIVKCNSEISVLNRKLSQLEEERDYLSVGIVEKDGKLSEFKITVRKLEDETISLEESNIKLSNDISLLETTVAEIEKEKECLANAIAKQDEELSSFKITLEKHHGEKNDLENDIRKRDNEILSLNENVSRIVEERDSCVQNEFMKKEELSELRFSVTKLQDDKNALEESILKRDSETQLLQSKVLQLENENESLVNEIALRDEELSLMKMSVDKLQEMNTVLDEVIVKRDSHISLQETSIGRLEEEKESLSSEITKKDEGLSVEKLNVEKLQEVNNVLEEYILERGSDISLQKTNVARLEKENESLLNDIAKKEEELSVMKLTVENLEHEKKVLEEEIVKRDSDKSFQEVNVVRLVNNIAKKDEELSVMKLTVEKLEELNNVFDKDIVKRDGDISLQTTSVDRLENEKESLVNDIAMRDEELYLMKISVQKLQEGNKVLEEIIVKRDSRISLQEERVARLDKEKESLVNDIFMKDEEFSVLKTTIEKLQAMNRVLEEDVVKRDREISLQEASIRRLEKAMESLSNDVVKKDEELSIMKLTVEHLQHEKKVIEENYSNRGNEISLLETTLVQLKKEKESLSNNITMKDEELSLMKLSVENLHVEKKVTEEHNYNRGNEISLLKSTLNQLMEEKESLANDIAQKEEELCVLKLTVNNLQNEKNAIQEDNYNRDNEIALLETTLAQLKEEKESLTSHLGKRDEELSSCKETIEKFEAQKNAHEQKIMECESAILLLKERFSKSQEEKQSVTNDLIKKDENLSAFDMTVEKLNNEKNTLEEDVMKCGNEIQLLESRVSKLQNENESLINDLVKKDEELSSITKTVGNLQHEKKVLEEDIIKRERDCSLQETNIGRLEKGNQALTDDLDAKDEELSGWKIDFENFQTEKEFLEENIVKRDNEISLFKEKITKLQDEKESLANNLVKQDGELSSFKIIVEELQNEKKAFEDDILERNSEVSSLESKVFNLQGEKEDLTNNIVEKDEQLSAFKKNIEKLEIEKNRFESGVNEGREEILLLGNNVIQIVEEKRSIEIKIQKRDEELLSIRESLHIYQDENKLLEKMKLELNEKISRYTLKNERNHEEINLLRNDLRKVTIEKENFENMIKEMNEKTKCDEEDFDKLVSGYLQEIDSWKKWFCSMEEEMSVLRNEMEKLQCEKQDAENNVKDTSESKRESEKKFQENIKLCHKEIDSWKVMVLNLESDKEILRQNLEALESECERRTLEIEQLNEAKGKNSKLYQEMVVEFQKQKENSEKHWILEKEKEMGNLRFELETKLQTMGKQFGTKENELHDRNISIERLKDEANQLNIVISEKKEEISNLNSKVLELEESRIEADNEIRELQQQCYRNESELKHSTVCMEELREKTRKFNEIISEKDGNRRVLENRVDELSKLNKEQEESRMRLSQEREKSENELKNLRDIVKSLEAKELAAKGQVNLMEIEVNRVKNELSAIEHQKNSETSVKHNIERSREQLRVLLADIDETSKVKLSLEEELRVLQSRLEQQSEEKTKLKMDVFCLKEITEELTKGKLTLLEEIARLSDQKKDGQERFNSEFARLRIANNELLNSNEKIQEENSEFIVQISSLKVTLATVESAYEQTQDEIKNHKIRFEELARRENQNKQEREKLDEKSKKLEVKIKHLEEKNRSIIIEKRELSSSLSETGKRLESLEKESQAAKGENILLLEQLKQQENGDGEGLDTGKSSNNTLRKKLKEFRARLSEEKKQRELHEFEIKNLKEKVERFTKNEREIEVQLESTRKKLLEVKTERDGLLMDLDSLNKRKKKDVEGYISRIETLEDELRMLKGKESKKADGKQTKETINVLNEEKKILELKLTSNLERHQREVTELKTTLNSLQNRYTAELQRFETAETANQKEILKLRKTLTSIERIHESQARELENLRANLVAITNEKEKIEKVLSEKNSEVSKWKKEALNDKAEIKFLRGSLNILEKEGLANKPPETDDRVTNE